MTKARKRLFGISWLAIDDITTVVAIAALILGIMGRCDQKASDRARIFVQFDVEQVGVTDDDDAICNVAAVFTNVGKAPVYVLPFVYLMTFDASYDPDTHLKPWQGNLTFDQHVAEIDDDRNNLPGAPVEIKPGKKRTAKSVDLIAPKPLIGGVSHNFLYFKTTDDIEYMVGYPKPEMWRYVHGTDDRIGWTAGAMAEKR